MDLDPFQRSLQAALDGRRAMQRLRSRRTVVAIDSTHVTVDGRTLINFASNDYLGLTHHPRVIEAMANAARDAGVGSGASGLVTGHTTHHEAAERAIARWKNAESAVLLPSGYQANQAAVQAIAAVAEANSRRVRFLLDKLVHASLIDVVRATDTAMRVFPHNEFSKLDRLLTDAPDDEMQIVVTESIFSMDGDAADLALLARLKHQHNFTLLLDEAHGSGVYGANGAGFAAECGFAALADVTIVTLSKALGVSGGAIVGSSALRDAVVNFGRAYIYSTSVSPVVAAGTEAAIRVLHDEPHRQARVRALATRMRAALTDAGVQIPPGDSPIILILLGSEEAAVREAARLESEGLLVVAIRPPTVAPGTSRLRITLSSEHTDEDIDRLLACAQSWRS